MSPDDMAEIHAAAFVHERSWTAQEFSTFLEDPLCTFYSVPSAFALTRTVAGEAELLTLAVHPEKQRTGQGDVLIRRWLDAEQADLAFLEVAADNDTALKLYKKNGFSEIARRRGYYRRKNAPDVDALIMQHLLT